MVVAGSIPNPVVAGRVRCWGRGRDWGCSSGFLGRDRMDWCDHSTGTGKENYEGNTCGKMFELHSDEGDVELF